jgi:hypothetical protein
MLRLAWDAYRGWAKRARGLQADVARWNLAALICVAAAAVFGALTALVPAAPSPWAMWAPWLSGAATLIFAIGAYLGREVVGSGKEPDWIQARATAEGIKSECFRFVSKAGLYAGAEVAAAKAFQQRIADIEQKAVDKGLTRADDPVPATGDKREPPAGMTIEWYQTNRIKEQIEYYQKGRKKNEDGAHRLWMVAFASGLAAVVFGALGAGFAQRFAPLIGAMTTIASAVAAYGLLERRKVLISSYAAMQSALERVLALAGAAPTSLAELVTTTEDLLESEHQRWLPQMLAIQHKAPQDDKSSAPTNSASGA